MKKSEWEKKRSLAVIIIILPSTGEKVLLQKRSLSFLPFFFHLMDLRKKPWRRISSLFIIMSWSFILFQAHFSSYSYNDSTQETLSLFWSSKPVSMISRQSSFISYVLKRSLFFTLKRCNPLGFLCLSYTISYMSCRDEFLGSLYQSLFFFLLHFWVLPLTTFTSCMTRASLSLSLFFIWTSLWEGFTWRYFMSPLLSFASESHLTKNVKSVFLLKWFCYKESRERNIRYRSFKQTQRNAERETWSGGKRRRY